LQKVGTAKPDGRRQALDAWVAAQLGETQLTMQPASSDASFRRYFRVASGGKSLVVMDAPPGREDCRPFVKVAELFGHAGVNVPTVLASDIERGFLLLEDLGLQTYLDVLDADNAQSLFADAIGALVRIQKASRPGILPQYDADLLRRELELFPEWYLVQGLGWTLDRELRAELDELFELLVSRALTQQRVFVHRDYMPRNLMISTPNPGVIDFQDAVYGPISYDPVCLVKDAFISWPEPRVLGWLEQYWRGAQAEALPVPANFDDFYRDCDFMGAQRHLKVIGIFARICYRDGKPAYLQDVPRFLAYLRGAADRNPELGSLRRLLDRLEHAQ
jgi:aminoglycoside/choline kinase family phosphotransferase